MANIIIRSKGWSPVLTQDLAKIYDDLSAKLSLFKISSTIVHEPVNNDLTNAENFGKYVRELFLVYSAILEEMKLSREWIALRVRSTDHSKVNCTDSIIIEDKNDSGQIQIRGFYWKRKSDFIL